MDPRNSALEQWKAKKRMENEDYIKISLGKEEKITWGGSETFQRKAGEKNEKKIGEPGYQGKREIEKGFEAKNETEDNRRLEEARRGSLEQKKQIIDGFGHFAQGSGEEKPFDVYEGREISTILGSNKKENATSFFSNRESCLLPMGKVPQTKNGKTNERWDEETQRGYKRKHLKRPHEAQETCLNVEKEGPNSDWVSGNEDKIERARQEVGEAVKNTQRSRIKSDQGNASSKVGAQAETANIEQLFNGTIAGSPNKMIDPVVRYLEVKNEKLVSENFVLNEKFKEAQARVRALEERLCEMEGVLEGALHQKAKEYKSIREERDGERARNKELGEQLKNAEKRNKKAEEDFNVRVAIIEEDKKQMGRKIDTLKREREMQEEEIFSLKARVDELSSLLMSQEALHRALRSEIESLTEEKEERLNTVQSCQDERHSTNFARELEGKTSQGTQLIRDKQLKNERDFGLSRNSLKNGKKGKNEGKKERKALESFRGNPSFADVGKQPKKEGMPFSGKNIPSLNSSQRLREFKKKGSVNHEKIQKGLMHFLNKRSISSKGSKKERAGSHEGKETNKLLLGQWVPGTERASTIHSKKGKGLRNLIINTEESLEKSPNPKISSTQLLNTGVLSNAIRQLRGIPKKECTPQSQISQKETGNSGPTASLTRNQQSSSSNELCQISNNENIPKPAASPHQKKDTTFWNNDFKSKFTQSLQFPLQDTRVYTLDQGWEMFQSTSPPVPYQVQRPLIQKSPKNTENIYVTTPNREKGSNYSTIVNPNNTENTDSLKETLI